MNLTIRELNELIYSLGTTATKGMMCDKQLNATLLDKLQDELNRRISEEAIDEEIESSTYYVSNEEADEDALHMLTSFPIVDPFTSDSEDLTSAQNNDYDRYESSVEKDYDNHLKKLKQRGYITQAILDYVDMNGAATYKEMNTYYKSITGSNSFSHHLYNLMTPYKNRKTQRFLAKEGSSGSDAKYIIKVANPYNWVVIDDNDEFSNL